LKKRPRKKHVQVFFLRPPYNFGKFILILKKKKPCKMSECFALVCFIEIWTTIETNYLNNSICCGREIPGPTCQENN
jgi:hypothetical protein